MEIINMLLTDLVPSVAAVVMARYIERVILF